MKTKCFISLAVFMLFFLTVYTRVTEAHILDESQRPVGRQMSVLWSSIGNPGTDGKAQIDKVISDAVYANVDTVTVGFGPACYILSEMYPENALYKNYSGAATVRDGKVDYFINKAHAANISVWLVLQGMALSGDPCMQEYFAAYRPKDINGGVLISNKIDWENPEGRRRWREMAVFMVKNHNFDGFWVEEPYSTITQSNTSAAKTALLSWGITDKLVLQNHGYDPRSLYNYSTKTLPDYVITDMLHEHEMLITQSYKELNDEIRALGPKYQYPDFLIAVGLNMEFYSPNDPPNNIIGHRGAMWGHNITELANKHYIDVWQSESSPATDSVTAYLTHLGYAVDHTPEILHTTGTYITDSAIFPVIDPNFFNKVPVAQPNGGSYEAIFANVHLNRTCIKLTLDKTGCLTYAPMSPKEWLHRNPPKKPRNYIPVRLIGASTPIPTYVPTIPTTPTLTPIPTPTSTPTPILINNLILASGWNQISSPVAEGINMSTIENSCSIVAYNNQKLWSWNAQTQSWINPQRVEPFKGYWINVARACTVTLSGTPASFTSVPLYTGWNKISASGSLNNIKGACSVVDNKVWKWDAVNKSWTHPSTLQPDKGYWIRVTGNCTLD